MTGAGATILVVEDDAEMRALVEEVLRERGHRILAAGDGAEALASIGRQPVDVVITDLNMPRMKGEQLLAELRALEPDLPVVVTTAFGSIESAVDLIKAGAYHYVAKPFRMEQLVLTVENALRERALRAELTALRQSTGTAGTPLVSVSAAMRAVVALVQRAALSDAPVLLLGESGTGKELLARALHAASPRRDRRFSAVNCSAIPDTLLESHLFGHRRGAFTDAREDRGGLFQETNGGTILLDEIGDMPPALQAKLLRVLQEREVHPLGAAAPVAVDVRVVAATHRDLQEMLVEGGFREDLYYRLNVIAVRVPPLRERPDDIVPLVAHFLEKHGTRLGRQGCTLTRDALDLLLRHRWPGNVRELENVIERGLVLGQAGTIRREDLPETVRACRVAPGAAAVPVGTLADLEREHILAALAAAGGNKAAAARMLGLDRKTLYRKLGQYGFRDA